MAEQAADSRIIFSSFVENLEETAKVRYNEKLAMLGGADCSHCSFLWCENVIVYQQVIRMLVSYH